MLSRRGFIVAVAAFPLVWATPTPGMGMAALGLWAGEALASGAVGAVGARMFNSLLGEPTIADVRTWLREAIAELEAFISTKLDEKTLEEMTAEVTGIQDNLVQFASLKPENHQANRFLIENAIIATARLVPMSLNYQQAYAISTAAICFRLVSIRGLFDLDNDAGHIASAHPRVDEFFDRAVVTYHATLSRLTMDARIQDHGNMGIRNFGFFTLDNREQKMGWQDEVHAFVDSQWRPRVTADFSTFQAEGAKALRSIEAAYDGLCRMIGGSYSYGKGLP